MNEKKKLSIVDLMGWGFLDVEELERRVEVAENFGVEIDEIKEGIEEFSNDNTAFLDINNWIYSTMTLTFNEVMRGLEQYIEETPKNMEDLIIEEREEIKNKIEELKDNFSPFINCIDSWYDNLLDNIDLTRHTEEVYNDIIDHFIKEIKKEGEEN